MLFKQLQEVGASGSVDFGAGAGAAAGQVDAGALGGVIVRNCADGRCVAQRIRWVRVEL